MKIIFLSFKISMLIFLGIACQKKGKLIESTPDLLAYKQLTSNQYVKMQPRNVDPVKPPDAWVAHSTSLGFEFSSPPDWKLMDTDDGIEIKNFNSSLYLKIQSEDKSSLEFDKNSPGILSIEDFSESRKLDNILSATVPEMNVFSRMDEDKKTNILALIGKKYYFFSTYKKISVLNKRKYFFKSIDSSEVMMLVFLGTKRTEVLHINGKWEGDENDLLTFLASINAT